ncbi:MAG: glycosyltransferase [Myxococcales bacterium]|nr:glycosyltransferase [Myxococcales bacterium]
MPVYNAGRYVADALDSVLSQQVDRMEIVVSDDCSTDSTAEILRDYERRYPTLLRVFRQSSNLGVTRNCNFLLKQCRGELIAFFAGDDLMYPNKLRRQLALHRAQPDCVFSYHDVVVFDDRTGDTIYHSNSGLLGYSPVVGSTWRMAQAFTLFGPIALGQSIMARRVAIPRAGYDERIPHASDWLFWIDFLAQAQGTVGFIPQALSAYRKHREGLTSGRGSMLADRLTTLGIIESRYPALRRQVREHRATIELQLALARRNLLQPIAVARALPAALTSGLTWREAYGLICRSVHRLARRKDDPGNPCASAVPKHLR